MSEAKKKLAILLVVLFVATVTAVAVDANIANSKCNCRYSNGIGNDKCKCGYCNGIGNGYGNGYGNCGYYNGIGNGYGNYGYSMKKVPGVQSGNNYQRSLRYHMINKGQRSCALIFGCS